MKWLLLAGALAAGPAWPAKADPAAAPAPAPDKAAQAEAAAAERKKLEEEIARELGVKPGSGTTSSSPAAPAPAAPAPAPGQAQSAATGGNPYARVLLLPDISAIGRGAMVWNQRDVGAVSPREGPATPAGKLQPVFQELEVALQSVVDPYLRADVFLTFGPDGAGVEEAYVTTLGLPAGFQVRAGTLKSPFGRLNQQHPHVWDFVDAPLAMSRLVAAEALEGPGVDVAWLAPLPWFAELHLAYQETVPGFEAEGRRTGVARLVQFLDLAEGATLGVGLSAARLDEPGPGVWRTLYGGDLFLKVRPPSGRAYLAVQGEIFGRKLSGNGDPAQSAARVGGYAYALLRSSAFWAFGVRWESSPSGAEAGSGREQRWGALASWYPSEFQRLRLQASRDLLPGGQAGWEGLLSLEFAIGAHGAHPF
jgi:hypothetical protein